VYGEPYLLSIKASYPVREKDLDVHHMMAWNYSLQGLFSIGVFLITCFGTQNCGINIHTGYLSRQEGRQELTTTTIGISTIFDSPLTSNSWAA
jgi:hypothetical protein